MAKEETCILAVHSPINDTGHQSDKGILMSLFTLLINIIIVLHHCFARLQWSVAQCGYEL